MNLQLAWILDIIMIIICFWLDYTFDNTLF